MIAPRLRRGGRRRKSGRNAAGRRLALTQKGHFCACENPSFTRMGFHIMDVEHINAIGNTLADLTKRTVDLRGYL